MSLLYISNISNISLLQYLGGLVECVYDRSTGRAQVKDSNSKLSLDKGLLQKRLFGILTEKCFFLIFMFFHLPKKNGNGSKNERYPNGIDTLMSQPSVGKTILGKLAFNDIYINYSALRSLIIQPSSSISNFPFTIAKNWTRK